MTTYQTCHVEPRAFWVMKNGLFRAKRICDWTGSEWIIMKNVTFLSEAKHEMSFALLTAIPE